MKKSQHDRLKQKSESVVHSHLLHRSDIGRENATHFQSPLQNRCMLAGIGPCCPIWVSPPPVSLDFYPSSTSKTAQHNPSSLAKMTSSVLSFIWVSLFDQALSSPSWIYDLWGGFIQKMSDRSSLLSSVTLAGQLQLWVRSSDFIGFHAESRPSGREWEYQA